MAHEAHEQTAAETILVEVWEEVLQTSGIGADDDFFSCGGDSLLAIQVIGEAQRRGVTLTLIDMFRYPTVRGVCATLDPAPERTGAGLDLLTPADREKVPPSVVEAMPATRLQLGVIYESLMSDGRTYVCTSANDVRRPLDEAVLRTAVQYVTGRHATLRTRFDLSEFSEAMQLVEGTAQIPVTVADHSRLGAEELTARTTAVMTGLSDSFDPEKLPLLRLHAAVLGPGSFRLTVAYHHALLDGWSAASLLSELVSVYAGLLEGEQPRLPDPLPYAHYVRLEREAAQDAGSRAHFTELAPAPVPSDVTPAGPARPAELRAQVPQASADRLFDVAASRHLPPKSILLAAYTAAVETVRGDPLPAVAVLTSGRPEEEGADLTLGLFVNYVPVRIDLTGATWAQAARRAFEAERDMLPHRRFPYAETLAITGPGAFQASFNYVHLRPSLRLVEEGLVEAGQFADVSIDIPLSLDVANTGAGLAITVDYDRACYDETFATQVLATFLTSLDHIVAVPDAVADPRAGVA
ncbi:condensation domain-containing protein [Kineosporia succinea]|uniref:Aryl carrier-like protein n=1 Tax=Kineosporia succinea TaxID=84632 RepID=A0ABT9PBW5_9ACTN|nr:condensation domain-containing protein [Kineosporia succinea]MDP9830199.1 aryl carrier-like protein [Kineosporia succinea]